MYYFLTIVALFLIGVIFYQAKNKNSILDNYNESEELDDMSVEDMANFMRKQLNGDDSEKATKS